MALRMTRIRQFEIQNSPLTRKILGRRSTLAPKLQILDLPLTLAVSFAQRFIYMYLKGDARKWLQLPRGKPAERTLDCMSDWCNRDSYSDRRSEGISRRKCMEKSLNKLQHIRRSIPKKLVYSVHARQGREYYRIAWRTAHRFWWMCYHIQYKLRRRLRIHAPSLAARIPSSLIVV